MLALALLLAVTPVQDTLRYQFEMQQDQDIDMSAMGGEGMKQSLGMAGRISIVVRDTVAGEVMWLRVDTATVTASNPMMAGMLAIPSGVTMSWAVINGEHVALEEPEAEQAMGLGLLGQVIAGFAVVVPDSLAVGVTWSDTSTADPEMAAQGMQSTSIAHWTITDRIGEEFVLEGTDTTSLSMEMEQATTGGTMTGTRRVVLRPDGLPREATSEQGGDLQMLLAGQAVTAKQRTRSTLRLLP